MKKTENGELTRICVYVCALCEVRQQGRRCLKLV
jgi:predicted RNA-binding protein with PUA domain